MVHRKRKIAEKLKDKDKLVVLNNETFEEKASVTLNRISVFAAISILVIVLILLTTALLVFTPLREYIPGYTDLSLRKEVRSEEHTSELQSLMRISYAVFCLKKKKHKYQILKHNVII